VGIERVKVVEVVCVETSVVVVSLCVRERGGFGGFRPKP
jgi:hypothetical protein